MRRGFTLVEVLVAVFILALLLIAAYGSVNALLRTRAILADQNERLRAMQFTVGMLERDLRQAYSRTVRDGYGATEPALVGARDAIVFTRAGAANPLQAERARVERVVYGLRDAQLSRSSFAVLDRTPSSAPVVRDLLPGVDKLAFRYLDAEQWREQWPPSNVLPRPLKRLPRAVEFSIETKDFGVITRLVDLPEVNADEAAAGTPPPGGLPPGGLPP